jgi:hypothetical protein
MCRALEGLLDDPGPKHFIEQRLIGFIPASQCRPYLLTAICFPPAVVGEGAAFRDEGDVYFA